MGTTKSKRMMHFKEFSIANKVRNFTLNNGGNDARFYVGITNNIQRRVFDEHEVDKETDNYDFWDAGSHDSADRIERYLLKKHPYFEGHAGLGREDSKYVYVYKIEDHTRERTNEGNLFEDLDDGSELITE